MAGTPDKAIIEAAINERWDVATVAILRLQGEPYPALDNSEPINAIRDAIEDLATLISEPLRANEESLETLRDGLMEEIETRIKAWAVDIEFGRQRKAAAA